MSKIEIFLVLGAVLTIHIGCGAAEAINPAKFIRQRGWALYESNHVARSPSPDIAPVLYYEKGGFAPSCGLITTSPQAGPDFIEILGPDSDVEWPQCLNIVSMIPFKLASKNYIAVEYVIRDTREDFYRSFHYVYRDTAKGYITDKILTNAVPNGPASDVSVMMRPASKAMDGVKFARAAHLAKAFPQWRLPDRDFILGKTSSFAILEDQRAQRCNFVAEGGAALVSLNHEEFAPGTKCVTVSASSRLEKAGTMYYLAMFKSDQGKQVVAVTSVSADGKVTAEKALTDAVNRSGATKDMKSAKVSLSNMLR
jgi:hypothetical protein